MVNTELEDIAFDYTDGTDIHFSESVANGIKEEVVIDYLKNNFPDKSFTDEEIKEVTKLIVSYAKDRVEFLRDDAIRDFEKELDNLLDYYDLRPLDMCKILIEKANDLFPNV